MKEDIFFKVGYSSYLQKEKNLKEKWTSKLFRKICEHKFLIFTAHLWHLLTLCLQMFQKKFRICRRDWKK